jgi:hypothetical protein
MFLTAEMFLMFGKVQNLLRKSNFVDIGTNIYVSSINHCNVSFYNLIFRTCPGMMS